MSRICPALWRCRDGIATAEFGLIAPVFLALLIAGIELARGSWMQSNLQFAAEEVGRFAMTHPTASPAALSALYRTKLIGLDENAVSVDISSENANGIPFITIVGQAEFIPVGYLQLAAIPLEGRARVPFLP